MKNIKDLKEEDFLSGKVNLHIHTNFSDGKADFESVIKNAKSKGYELIAGERRTKAARLAGFKTIPAIIKDFDDTQMMELALVENIQRENLNPIDEAMAYENIIKLSKLYLLQTEALPSPLALVKSL